MSRVLLAGVIALLISILAGPKFIGFLRRKELGQHIREEGPEHHVSKQGTPTMGGLLILFAAAIGFLAFSRYTVPALTVLFVTLACGAIGFLDDFIKLTHRRSLGLNGRWKLILLGAITVGVGIAAQHQHLPTSVYIPGVGDLELSYAWYGLLFLVIAGAANGVNLTDGVDGLAAGTVIIALFTFASMIVISWIRSGPPGHRFETKLDLGIAAAALIGAAIGFLWYNAWPAEVFMGDTGSMALGGSLAAFAIFTKTIFLLLLIGGIFALVALSVIIQVFSFKYFKRRVFLMAPIQHHFELKAWSETKIMVRFWIVTGLLCAIGFALYYRYFTGFRLQTRQRADPQRVLVLGLARSGKAAVAALERRGVEVAAADRELGNDDDVSLLDGVERAGQEPGRPARGAARRRGASGEAFRSGARSSSATGCCSRGSSASPARTARRRPPSCSARSSTRRPRGTSAAR